jgi:hypothetical protein
MTHRITKAAFVAAAMALGAGLSSTANAGTRYTDTLGYDYSYFAPARDTYAEVAYAYGCGGCQPVFRAGDIAGLHHLERMR